jgi:hypothetical protein
MEDSGLSRTVPMPKLPDTDINSLLKKKEVATLINRFPQVKQRLECLLSAAALADIPSARPEILNLLGLIDVDLAVGVPLLYSGV